MASLANVASGMNVCSVAPRLASAPPKLLIRPAPSACAGWCARCGTVASAGRQGGVPCSIGAWQHMGACTCMSIWLKVVKVAKNALMAPRNMAKWPEIPLFYGQIYLFYGQIYLFLGQIYLFLGQN